MPKGAIDLADVLEPLRRKHHLPALGAAVVTPDRIDGLGVAGVRAISDSVAACVGDAFHLGSDSKAMTAVVLAKLVEQGALSWSTRIGDVLGDLPHLRPEYAGVTLEQLLAHRAGLPHDPRSRSLDELRSLPGDVGAQREAYASIALGEPPERPPGSEFSYSNVGYVLAGLMAERVTHRRWEDLVTELVFRPLFMPNAGFGVTASVDKVDGLWAHTMSGDTPAPKEPGPGSDNPLYIAPAGSVHVSMEGWARFVQDLLTGMEGRGRLLKPNSYHHLFEAPFGGFYAHGWVRVARPKLGGVVFTHAGSNTMNFAVAWLLPSRRLAVLVATNAGGGDTAQACDDVVVHLLEKWRAIHP